MFEHDAEVVRLSSWVRFVESRQPNTAIAAVHTLMHTRTGSAHHGSGIKISKEDRDKLLGYVNFRKPDPDVAHFVKAGILVHYGTDPISVGHARDLRAADLPPDFSLFPPEAELLRAYEDVCWSTGRDSEHEYQWGRVPLCKSAEDLLFYEMLVQRSVESVLELGASPGGSAQFFIDRLQSTLSEAIYVGVDDGWMYDPDVPCSQEWTLISDKPSDAEGAIKTASPPSGYDLIVIDWGETPEERIALLNQYAPLVSPRGFIVIEDLCMPESRKRGNYVSLALDDFLMRNSDFGILPEARSFSTGRALRGAFARKA